MHRLMAVGLSVATCLGACGGGHSNVTAENVGKTFASTFCAAKGRCCQDQGAPLAPSAAQSCQDIEAEVPHQGQAFGGNTVFNADVAAACLQAADAYACENSNDVDRLCRLVFSGQAKLGEGCLVDSDCQQSPDAHAVCPLGQDVCVAIPFLGQDGAPCVGMVNVPFDCAFFEGFTCVSDPASTTAFSCRRRSPVGATCAGGADRCETGSFCGPGDVCTQEGGLGEPCGGSTRICAFPLVCDANGVCADTASGTCVAI